MMRNTKLYVCVLSVAWLAGLSQAALVTYWDMNETIGSLSVIDKAGSSDGPLNVGAQFAASNAGVGGVDLGNALALPGGTTPIYYSNEAQFNFGTNDFTVTGWIQTDLVGSTSTLRPEVFAHGDAGGRLYLQVGKPSIASERGKMKIQVDDVSLLSDGRIDNNVMHWYAMVVSNGTIRMYIDGVRQSGSTAYLPTTSATPTDAPVHQGRYFTGLLDDMRFYDTALAGALDGETLTGGELYDVWQYGNVPTVPQLVTHWDMNETVGSPTVIDKAGLCDGPLNDVAEFAPSTAGVGAADLGNMLSYSGGSSVVFYSNETRFNFGTNDFTATGWIQLPLVGSTSSDRPTILSHADAGGGMHLQVGKPSQASERGKMKIQVDDVALLSDTRIDNNIMHWYAMVVSNGTIRMYIDGELQSGSTAYLPTTSATPTGAVLHQGRYFTGMLDDLRFYNTALTGTLTGSTLDGGDLYDVWQVGVAEAPAIPATVAGFSMISSNVLKMVINATSDAGRYWPEGTENLVAGSWTNVAHSDDGVNAFVVTNLNYSTADGTNKVIYLQATNTAGFFQIIGE